MPFGTLTTLDSLGASATQTVAGFGEDRVFDAITAHLRIHNGIMTEMLAGKAERSSDRLRRYGGVDTMVMEDADQFGVARAQKVTAGSNVGFPLRLKTAGLQWTRKALRVMSLREIDAQVTAMLAADVQAVTTELKRALFLPTNYTFTDVLVDNVDLPVKRLVNADSAVIPVGPNGETFDAATHTHYLAAATLTTAALDGLIDTVREHYNVGQVMVEINKAQETTVRGLTGFAPYTDPRLINQSTALVAGNRLDITNPNNRAIGLYREAEIWVKPWMPATYLFGMVDGAPKPLVMRTRDDSSGDLELVANDEDYPLRAERYEREFGVGVGTRTNGAALYIGGGSYVAPTL